MQDVPCAWCRWFSCCESRSLLLCAFSFAVLSCFCGLPSPLIPSNPEPRLDLDIADPAAALQLAPQLRLHRNRPTHLAGTLDPAARATGAEAQHFGNAPTTTTTTFPAQLPPRAGTTEQHRPARAFINRIAALHRAASGTNYHTTQTENRPKPTCACKPQIDAPTELPALLSSSQRLPLLSPSRPFSCVIFPALAPLRRRRPE